MAIEDFEWEGDLQMPPASRPRPKPSEAKVEGWLSRLKKSVWLEPALRLGGTVLLLGVLAGIGVVATTYAKPGLELPDAARPLAAALGTSWLKPTPAPSGKPPMTLPTTVIAGSSGATEVASAVAAPAASTRNAASPVEAPPNGGAASGITPDGKVVLNVASADELTQLPGVGMKRAQAIVALRVKLKRFKSPTDLLRVKGIGPRGLQRMLPHLVLDAP
jgi:competence protein ComEA